MVFLFCAHTYVVQKDLITLAIKNRMVSRQQSQLTEFLGEQQDPVFVFSPEKILLYCNERAK
jgi:hypothetical protein